MNTSSLGVYMQWIVGCRGPELCLIVMYMIRAQLVSQLIRVQLVLLD